MSQRSERGEQLVALFAKTIGEDAALDLVKATCAKLNMSLASVDGDGAVEVLEEISNTEGLIGVTARFAKVRFMLPSASAAAG